MVSQQIDLQDAVDWLIEIRESANYRKVRFEEPGCGGAVDHLAAHGLRRTLNGYLDEASVLYVFDPDHAIVAYPLRALQLVGTQLSVGEVITLSMEEQSFLHDRAKDRAGNLPGLIAEMKRLELIV